MLHMYTRCVHCVYHTRSRYMNTLSWLSLELHTSIAPALPLGWAPTYRDQQITKTTKGDKHQLSYFEGLLFWELEPALLVLRNWLGSEWTRTKYEWINNKWLSITWPCTCCLCCSLFSVSCWFGREQLSWQWISSIEVHRESLLSPLQLKMVAILLLQLLQVPERDSSRVKVLSYTFHPAPLNNFMIFFYQNIDYWWFPYYNGSDFNECISIFQTFNKFSFFKGKGRRVGGG